MHKGKSSEVIGCEENSSCVCGVSVPRVDSSCLCTRWRLNGDGKVDIQDVALVARCFGARFEIPYIKKS